jgi:hypothetical protein
LTFYKKFGKVLVLRVRKNQIKIMNNQDINERIENFMQLVNQNMHNHYRNNFPSTYSETSEDHQYVVADTGRKFLRIASTDRDGNFRSVYCFIALVDGNTKSMGSYSVGDILKPATWKAPAKHPRGSVFADDFGLSCVGPYGVDYLTGGGGYKFSPMSVAA